MPSFCSTFDGSTAVCLLRAELMCQLLAECGVEKSMSVSQETA
jgi:hypothetical protein